MYIRINKEGRAYLAGKEYSADQYEQFLGQLYDHVDRFGRIPSTHVLSRQLRISKSTAHKVIKIHEGSHMLDATKRTRSFINTQKQCDYGSRALNEEQQIFLLALYQRDESMCLHEYQRTKNMVHKYPYPH